jgi:hypothetical protein
MSKKIFTTLAFMLFTVLVFAQRNQPTISANTSTSSPQLAEAKNFGLSLMKAYFERNCNFVYSKMANEIMVFEGGAKVKKVQFSANDICNEVMLRDDVPVSYDAYLLNYEPEVLSANQFAAKYPAYQNVLQLKEGDFFFGGNKLKSGGTELFMSIDHTRFILKRVGLNTFFITVF